MFMRKPTVNLASLSAGKPTQPGIPPSKLERDRLVRVVASYVAVRKPVPPLSAGELLMHADSIIKADGIDPSYRKLIGILVNNEAWRDTVAGIPCSRRLLLLPKCFRVEGKCPGTFDEFGLKCKRCGQCAIEHLQAEAERLGYVVLVAEGAAVVTAMIESARIEAIVGVSCTSVLERVFPHMEAAAIPGIAVPLLYDGCRDTAVDFDWVWDAIHLSGADQSRRLDMDGLRAQVDSWLTLDGLRPIMGEPANETERIARGWLAKSGKRWRPFLVACACQASADRPDGPLPRDLPRVAVAVECFHKASLIHDDIEDGDATRYGEKTLHHEHGVPVALNVGDFLLGEGYRLIASCSVPPERREAMIEAAIAGHRQLSLGQGEELLWMRSPRPLSPVEVLAIFRQKTAPAFHVALRLGTLLAGGDAAVDEVIAHYSEFLGTAYQIRDDIEDFDPPADRSPTAGEGPAHPTSDMVAMRPSLLLAIAHELARGSDRELIEHLWLRQPPAPQAAAELARIFGGLNVRQTTSQLLESYKAEAIRSLSPLASASLKGLLRRVIGRIFDESELKGWCSDAQTENAAGSQPGAESAA